MITGDHKETARKVAVNAGIISAEEMYDESIVITGQQFREEIGAYTKIWDPVKEEFRIEFCEGKQRFDQVKKRVKVIARCTSEDKFVFVCGIKQKGGLVGMTGDSISDAEALKKADVGFCMGSGCDVAKDNSDLVILDNDFESIHSAIKWGRTIFDNVRKFLQFQLTINIVICFITILGGCTVGVPPLNVIQMLWINLMMDILGAIAIGTEPYKKTNHHSLSLSARISRKDNIVKLEMLRQIVCQSAYQLIVMIILMYFGGLMFFDKSFNLVLTPLRDETTQKGTDRLVLNTICFHTFFLMNWFNTINCRVLDANDINPFKTLLNNPYLWIIMGMEMAVQLFMINAAHSDLGSALLGTAPMTLVMHISCWVFGAFSLVVNVILKQIPLEKFTFAQKIDLESSAQKPSQIDRFFDRTDDFFKKASTAEDEAEEKDVE